MALITCEECGASISDRAPACPHCGDPRTATEPPHQSIAAAPVAPAKSGMGLGRKLVIGFFGAIGVIYLAGSIGGRTSPPSSGAGSQSNAPPVRKEVLAATAQELFEAYQSNEVATDIRLKGKIIQISGRIQSIDKNVFDSMYISLETSNRFMPTKVQTNKQDESKVAQLSRGQQVVFRCQSIHRWVGSPMGEDCSLYGW
ncbi:OB-fold protein [Bradyrhizobium sp. USDA 4520]